MTENKAITYSLLAHIRNTGTLIKGPVDVFTPLIKRVLHRINSKQILKGQSIIEIKNEALNMYSIDFPIPVLKTILTQIALEVNKGGEENFKLHLDNSFMLKDFYFEDFEEKIQESKRDIESIEKLFKDFAIINNIEITDKTSIFDFIDKNRGSISRYLCLSEQANGHDYLIEAQFVDYFKKIPSVFEIIRNIYLGSIISCYLEFKTENIKQELELLFDTNFIVSLLDLNTPESTHTCIKLIEVGKNIGFSFSILPDTIEEIKNLLSKKAEYYSNTFLSKRINPEDIYNACERRKLGKNDIERIIDNLENSISSFGIKIIANTEKLKNKAKYGEDIERLKKIRSSNFAALHDATALLYVKEKRKKRVKEFEDANCWFVNNSITHDSDENKNTYHFNNDYQSETIRADELLNILWLTNPSINQSINNDDLIEIGISSIVALTLNNSLPKASIIRELDENIQKYKNDEITDKDIILVSSRISNRQLKNINELNTLANNDSEEFVRRIKEEVTLQEKLENEKLTKLEDMFQKFEKTITSLDKERKKYIDKKAELDLIHDANLNSKLEAIDVRTALETEKNLRLNAENELRKINRNKFITKKVIQWRAWILIPMIISFLLFCFGVLYYLSIANWNCRTAIDQFKDLNGDILHYSLFTFLAFLITAILTPAFVLRFFNNSCIEAYKKAIEIPKEFLET